MGSKVIGNTIYISKELSEKITPRERKVLLGHEISHWQHKDHLKMLFIKPLSWLFPRLANYMRRRIEIRADREAIKKTKDVRAFISLLDKLTRDDETYPDKQFSLQMANDMAGTI